MQKERYLLAKVAVLAVSVAAAFAGWMGLRFNDASGTPPTQQVAEQSGAETAPAAAPRVVATPAAHTRTRVS